MIISFMNSICKLIFPCLCFIPDGPNNESSNGFEDEQMQTCCSDSSPAVTVSELPDSVILEIMLKLPIKTIVRCRCVSKSWYKLTYEPYFAQTYYTNPPFTTIAFNYDDRFNFLEIGSSGDVIHTRFNPNVTALPQDRTSLIKGSCHGLLCVVQSSGTVYRYSESNASYDEQMVYIVNPMLQQLIVLPPVEKAKRITADVVYAFGCSSNGDWYKVVRIVTSYEGDQDEWQTHGEIITIGVDEEWRILEDSSFSSISLLNLFPCGVSLNGLVHLVGEISPDEDEDGNYINPDDEAIGFILAFDIDEEKGQAIMFPPGIADDPMRIKLTVCDDKLCFADHGIGDRVDIWMMKEYGVAESWSKEIVLKTWIPCDLRSSQFIPVATLGNGDLLMSRISNATMLSCPEHLIRFDRKTKMCSRLEVSCSGFSTSFLFAYVPSFFPRLKM